MAWALVEPVRSARIEKLVCIATALLGPIRVAMLLLQRALQCPWDVLSRPHISGVNDLGLIASSNANLVQQGSGVSAAVTVAGFKHPIFVVKSILESGGTKKDVKYIQEAI